MSSPSSLISLGLGSWGSASLLVTLGFGIGAATAVIRPHAGRVLSIQAEDRITNIPAEDRIVEVQNDI